MAGGLVGWGEECVDALMKKGCEIKKGGGWEGGLKCHKLWNTT